MIKRPLMFSVMCGAWLICLLYFDPRLLALLIGPESIAAKFFLILLIFFLNVFWFYVFFHLVIVSFSYLQGRNPSSCRVALPHGEAQHSVDTVPQPKVALLYTTCNDFQEEAAMTHIRQDYPAYHLFILDDSSSGEYRQRVDEFAKRFSSQVTVIRRQMKTGFKAGNINYALRNICREYAYFSVSDSDTQVPPNYISGLLLFLSNPQIAFAQSTQISNTQAQTPFAQCLRINTDLHFRRYASTKNRYGFVMWYGHGALMRRDVWERVGGLPEIATEDLAFSMKIRQAGFEGVFVENIACIEDFPPSYKQYRKRNEKWIRGTAECLLKFYPSFVKAKNIPWFEKADALVSGISLLLDLPFISFLFLVGILLPFFFREFQFQGAMFKIPVSEGKTPLAILAQVKSNLFYSWDAYLLLFASVFAPLIPAIIDYIRKPAQLLKHLGAYIYCFFALQIVSSINLTAFLCTRKSIFPITGDQTNEKPAPQERVSLYDIFSSSHANHRLVFLAETLMGVFFCIIAISTRNVWFVPVSFALVLSPYVCKWNLNVKLMRVFIFAPFLITLWIIYCITKSLS